MMNPRPPTPTRAGRLIARVAGFLSGGNFPAFALFALVFYQVFVAVMAFAPPSGGVWGEFVEEFRLRCFTYDSRSGWMELGSVWVMLAEPLPLQALFFFIWRAPLRDLWRKRRGAMVPLAGSALLLVGLIAVSLLGLGRATPSAAAVELPFPADRLRSALPTPDFELTNQDGEAVRLADFKGRVVLMTAVYSTCTSTCPMMLGRIRTVLDELSPEERAQLAVVAFSLSPEADTLELRSATARIYGMSSPQFHFVNGRAGEVNDILDQLSVVRTRDEATGEIMHSNLFFLIDREGRIAYRLSLSRREQSWLGDALRALLADPAS